MPGNQRAVVLSQLQTDAAGSSMAWKEEYAGLVLRAYEGRDRESVRKISYETADAGRSGESICGDRELIADVLTAYYTDFEPGSSLVAEAGGEVVGYVNGCLDTGRSLRVTLLRVWPAAAARAAVRGGLWKPDIWRLAWSAFAASLTTPKALHKSLARHRAHLHVNLLPEVRARGVARRLIERFLEQIRAAGVSGVHASVREDNAIARRFFEKAGFAPLGRRRTILTPRSHEGPLYSVIYAKKL